MAYKARKRKVKKNVPVGAVHIQATFNNTIITISDENDLILWDVTDPDSIYIIKGHTDYVSCLCVIEGNKFASVSKDKTLKIWA